MHLGITFTLTWPVLLFFILPHTILILVIRLYVGGTGKLFSDGVVLNRD